MQTLNIYRHPGNRETWTHWLSKGILLGLAWLVGLAASLAQPACIQCCCGDAEEVWFPCGDFEEPPLAPSGGWIDYGAGQTYCGWMVVSGTISIHHGLHNNLGLGNPNGPSQHLDLNGSSNGTVERTLTGLLPDKQYTITLWYAAHNGAGLATCHALINNGNLLDETWSTSVSGEIDWEERCLTFIADAPSVVIRLEGSSNNPCCGMLIDDMSMWVCDADSEPPMVSDPPQSPVSVQCANEVPPVPVLVFTDNCDQDPQVEFTEEVDMASCMITHTRTWTVEDACGNSTSWEQVIEVVDTQPPVFDLLPEDIMVPCGADVLAEFYAWIQMNGNAIATDQCDQDLEWMADFIQEPESTCSTVTVTFQVSDDCGNTSTATATFSVVDMTPPVLITPAQDKSVYCVLHPQDSLATWLGQWGGATAADPCGVIQWSHDFSGDSLAPVIEVNFMATDGCGNSIETTAFFFQVTSSDTLVTSGWTCDPLLVGADTVSVTQEGCETVTITTIHLAPSDTIHLSAATCDPQMVGSDTLFYNNQYGCDSLRITQTSLLPSDQTQLQGTTCDPGQVGQDSLLLQNQYGCDSLVITQTVLLPSDVQTIQLYTCDPQAAGLDTLLLTNQYGCDSTVFITTTYTGTYQATFTVLICGQGVNYLDTLVVTSGPCDSLFITQYQYTPLDTTWLTGSTCQASQAGTFVQVLPDQFGCDSTIITVMTLSPSDTTLVEGVTCNKTDEFYDEQTLTNQWGCDSVVWTAIIYIGVDTQYLQQTTCDPALAGIQTVVIPGPFCDTVRVIETIWLPFTTSMDTLTVCDASGPITDTLFLVNQAGCDSLVIRTYQYTDLQATWLLTDETCAGYANGEIEVTDVQGGVLPYAYRLHGGPWQTDGSFPGLPPGSYDLEVRDAGDCQLLISGQVIGAGEVLVIDAGPDRTAKVGDVIDLTVQSSSALAQVQWTATDPLSCSSCPQTALGPMTTSQTAVVNGVSDGGCPGQDLIWIEVSEQRRVYIPNSFSPNDDGINDIFRVFTLGDGAMIRNLAIYDRWGNAVWQQKDMPVDDPSAGWDGTFRARVMDPGVYVYVVELDWPDGQRQLFKGDIALIR